MTDKELNRRFNSVLAHISDQRPSASQIEMGLRQIQLRLDRIEGDINSLNHLLDDLRPLVPVSVSRSRSAPGR